MPNVAYPEKEVNQRLAVHHPDVASLRRYLVEWHYMRREAGIYGCCPERSGRRPDPASSPAVRPASDLGALGDLAASSAVGRVAPAHGRLDQPVVAIASPIEHCERLFSR